MNHFLIILLLLISNIHSLCLNYTKGDSYPSNSSSYCLSIIQWAVSEETLETIEERDESALQNYQQLYNNYYKKKLVNIDCLGVSKYFFCAKAYPTCSKSDMEIEYSTVCDWICELFSIRCGTDSSLYQEICVRGSTASTTCSWEAINILVVSLFAFLLMIY